MKLLMMRRNGKSKLVGNFYLRGKTNGIISIKLILRLEKLQRMGNHCLEYLKYLNVCHNTKEYSKIEISKFFLPLL